MSARTTILAVAFVLLLAYLVTWPHLVTVWRVVGADGTVIETAVNQAACENDTLAHNAHPADVNTYGKSVCRSTIEFRWGW